MKAAAVSNDIYRVWEIRIKKSTEEECEKTAEKIRRFIKSIAQNNVEKFSDNFRLWLMLEEVNDFTLETLNEGSCALLEIQKEFEVEVLEIEYR